MDDGKANIDLLFRNGLKDYEVLPPPGVWNDISPSVRMKQRPLLLLRVAAVAAVFLSLAVLAYRMSNELASTAGSDFITQNPESFAPEVLLASAEYSPAVDEQDNLPPPNAGQPVIYPVNTVNTENLNTLIQNFSELSSDANEERTENAEISQYDLMTVEYDAADYLTLGEYSDLDLPDNTTRKEPGRWSVSALVSPTYQSRVGGSSNETYSGLLAQENPIISYSGGLALSYRISKRLSIQSGVYYSSIGKELTGISAYSGFEDHFYTKGNPNFEVLTTNGSVYTENNDIFLSDNMDIERVKTAYNNNIFDPEKAALTYLDNSLHQNFRFLELPVVIRYKIIDKALDFNLIGGLSSNLLVDNSVYAGQGSRMEVGKTSGLNIITFSSSVGMGMEYNISGNLSLNLEPTFRYLINPFSNISYTGIHTYYFNVFSGISYKF